jgi:hypothetical protein
MSRYYPAVNPKSSVHPVLLGIRSLYYLQSATYYLSVDVWWGTTVHLHYRQQHMSGVLEYVRTKRQERTSSLKVQFLKIPF